MDSIYQATILSDFRNFSQQTCLLGFNLWVCHENWNRTGTLEHPKSLETFSAVGLESWSFLRSGYVKIAIEDGPVEIVDLPINSMVDLSSSLC